MTRYLLALLSLSVLAGCSSGPSADMVAAHRAAKDKLERIISGRDDYETKTRQWRDDLRQECEDRIVSHGLEGTRGAEDLRSATATHLVKMRKRNREFIKLLEGKIDKQRALVKELEP